MDIPDELNALLAAMKLSGKEPAWKFSASTDQVTVQLTWTKAKEQEASSSKPKPALKRVNHHPPGEGTPSVTTSGWQTKQPLYLLPKSNKPPSRKPRQETAGKRSRIDFDEGFDIDDPDLLRTPPHTSPVINADSKEAIQTAMLAARPDTPYQQHQRSRSKMKAKRQTDTDRVGGRTFSVPLKTGTGTDIFDLGGQWVGTSQVDVMDLLKELGIDTYSQYIQGRKFMQVDGHKISSYTSSIPSLSFFSLIDLDRSIKKNFMILAAKDCLVSATRCMMGVELSQISVLYFLSYVNAAGSLQKLIEATENCGQEFKIKGGAQQISKQLVSKLAKDTVKLSHPVLSIEQTKDCVIVKTLNGTEFKCKSVIMATPPNMTNKINFKPNLPAPKKEIMNRMPVGLLNKVIITYEKSFWREAGCSGEIVTIGGPSSAEGCDEGPLCIVYDATSSNNNAALVAFIGGKQAVQWQLQPEADRQSAVLKSLSSFFGDSVWNYKDYREQDWGLEPYSEGSPVCCAAPGAMPYFVSGFVILLTESATRWCGFMNGAVQAGKRAAFEVIYRFHPQAITREEVNEAFVISRTDLKLKQKSSHLQYYVFGIGTVIGAGLLFTVYFRLKS
ncbi:MAO [Mytilus edulis]|uniref:monoamine oxidase n=1 Tax=Mytilus edulis TaxID=6550 RepID=A0A8S3UL00_MYTED|nr:MAO [Mytilus edulis]